MPDFVLTVWAARDPAGGDAPICLKQRGVAAPIATNGQGFDTRPFIHDGKEVEPESVLSSDGLLNEPLLEFVGDELWKRLTPGAIGAELVGRLSDSRVYLDLRSEALYAYPWEVLRCQNVFVFAVDGCIWSIGRPEQWTGPFVGTPPDLAHPLRVMVVIGNKPDDNRLLADDELERIERHAHLRNADVLLKALFRPNPDTIEAALKDFNPHIFHFIGHGDLSNGKPVIHVWAQDVGIKETWDSQRIGTVFRGHPPRLVVLNACLTAAASSTHAGSLAQAFLEAGCFSVLAMMGEIRGDASSAFSDKFYEHLFDGEAVDEAVASARRFLQTVAPPHDPQQPETAASLRSNWPLSRIVVRGDAGSVVDVSTPGAGVRRWLSEDFVDRWDHRWDTWCTLMFKQSRLAVLCGDKNAGKSELLMALAEVWSRSGSRVIDVDVSRGATGDWHELLKRVTARAEKSEGVDAERLKSVVDSGKAREQLIRDYLEALEECAGGDFVLVVLDGISEWDKSLIEDTVLPEICAPFLRADDPSRVRMMIALRDRPDASVWGAVPSEWAPIEVGDFSDHEWVRAVKQFESHWLSQIKEDKQQTFAQYVSATVSNRTPAALGLLRMVAQTMRD